MRGSRDYKVSLLKQKLIGAAIVLAGLVSVPVCDMDATAALVLIPVGIACLITSEVFIDL